MWNVRVSVGARHVAASKPSRRHVVVAVAVAVGLLAIVGPCGPPRLQFHTPAPWHPVVSANGSEFVANIDNAYLVNASSICKSVRVLATAPLVRTASILVALSIGLALVALAVSAALLVVPAGRGPPRGLTAALTGQDQLVRYCQARR